MSKDLVELMANSYTDKLPKILRLDIATQMLSVVKEHIGEVACVCNYCSGDGEIWNGQNVKICKNCNGSCVIARTEAK